MPQTVDIKSRTQTLSHSTPLKWMGAMLTPRGSWPLFWLNAFRIKETNRFRPFKKQNKTLIRGDAEHPAGQRNITTLVWERGNTSRAADAWAARWREKRSQEKHREPAREEESRGGGRRREEERERGGRRREEGREGKKRSLELLLLLLCVFVPLPFKDRAFVLPSK